MLKIYIPRFLLPLVLNSVLSSLDGYELKMAADWAQATDKYKIQMRWQSKNKREFKLNI